MAWIIPDSRAIRSETSIVHSRDYTDPITGARMLGRVPELVAELTGSA